MPSFTLLAQSVLSGIFVGGVYGLLGLGLSLSWGLLRLINLAHFALAFLGAYLTYTLSSTFGVDPLWSLALVPPAFFGLGALSQLLFARFGVTQFGSLLVTFGPRARTAWHTHPHGQTLHIVSGVARIGRDGGTVEELQPGDAVTFEPHERHWHGAGPGGEMAHVAIARPDDDGRPTYWEARVTDAEYGD